MTDDALTPDPEAVVSRFDKEFEQYLYYMLLDLPAAQKEAESLHQARPANARAKSAAPGG